MFGKINLSFSKNQQSLQNIPQQTSKTVNSFDTQNTSKTYNSTINNEKNNQTPSKNIQQQKTLKNNQFKHNNLSNPSYSNFSQKQKTDFQFDQKHNINHDNNKTKKIKKLQNQNALKKSNLKKVPSQSLQSQMQGKNLKYEGSKFRILNQLLYTTSSQQAMSHFQQNPQDYQTYHEGYRYQSAKWQSKPVNVLIKHFRKQFKNYKDKIICDLGCGEGFLFEGLTKENFSKENEQAVTIQVKNKHIFKSSNIYSFDLVALKPFIKVADIKNLPLQKQSVDVTVFCLSLMGKNYLDFIQEAHRVLRKVTGELIIAEVQSRSKDWKGFVQMVEMVGFKLINNGVTLGSRIQTNENRKIGENKGKYFRMLHFLKIGDNEEPLTRVRHDGRNYKRQELKQLSQLLLTECIYKKR